MSFLPLKATSHISHNPTSPIFYGWKSITGTNPKSVGKGCPKTLCLLKPTIGSQYWGREELRTMIPSTHKKTQFSSTWFSFQNKFIFIDYLNMWSYSAIEEIRDEYIASPCPVGFYSLTEYKPVFNTLCFLICKAEITLLPALCCYHEDAWGNTHEGQAQHLGIKIIKVIAVDCIVYLVAHSISHFDLNF